MHWLLAHGMQSPRVINVWTQLDSGLHCLTPLLSPPPFVVVVVPGKLFPPDGRCQRARV